MVLESLAFVLIKFYCPSLQKFTEFLTWITWIQKIKPSLVKICIANVDAFKFSFFIFLLCTHVLIGCHSILLILLISLLVTQTITNNSISFSGDFFFSLSLMNSKIPAHNPHAGILVCHDTCNIHLWK